MELLYRKALEEFDSFCRDIKRLWTILLDETPIVRRFTNGWLDSADISKTKKGFYQELSVRANRKLQQRRFDD